MFAFFAYPNEAVVEVGAEEGGSEGRGAGDVAAGVARHELLGPRAAVGVEPLPQLA